MELRELRRYYNKVVVYDGDDYILRHCLEGRNEKTGELDYTLELQSCRSNKCGVYCGLHQVSVKEVRA